MDAIAAEEWPEMLCLSLQQAKAALDPHTDWMGSIQVFRLENGEANRLLREYAVACADPGLGGPLRCHARTTRELIRLYRMALATDFGAPLQVARLLALEAQTELAIACAFLRAAGQSPARSRVVAALRVRCRRARRQVKRLAVHEVRATCERIRQIRRPVLFWN